MADQTTTAVRITAEPANHFIFACVVVALFASSPGIARAATDQDDDFKLGVTQVAPGNQSAMVESGSAAFSGNPASSAFGWWPEDLVVAPIPGYSPEIGWNIAIGGGYFLDLAGEDSDAPASLVGIGAMTSENGSNAFGVGSKFHLRDDRLRIEAALGALDLNYRFWGIGPDAGGEGQSLDINQEGNVAFVAAKWETLPDLYIGIGFLAGDTVVAPRSNQPIIPELPDPAIDLDLAAVQIPLDFDSRDDEYFPRTGWKVGVRAFVYDEAVGSDFDAAIFTVEGNKYLPMRDRDVLALRGYFKAAGDDAPFFLLSSFGGRTDLRGYETGRYRDNLMYAMQAEYRWRRSDRWVFTGFAGVGEVADDVGGFFEEFLPAAGVGTRFMISVEHQISLSADVAWGKHGSQFYFGVGEAF